LLKVTKQSSPERPARALGIDTPEAMPEQALGVLQLGIQVIKIKGSNDMDLDIKRIKAVREAVGDEVGLRLDPNAAWTTIGLTETEIEESIRLLLEQDRLVVEGSAALGVGGSA